MSADFAWIPLVLLSGAALGLFFYGGLWLTVRAAPGAQRPQLLLVASFWIRNIVVIVGFVLAMDGHWQRAVVCLAGFVAARYAWMHRMPDPRPGKGQVR